MRKLPKVIGRLLDASQMFQIFQLFAVLVQDTKVPRSTELP